jgi:hypothetical protein
VFGKSTQWSEDNAESIARLQTTPIACHEVTEQAIAHHLLQTNMPYRRAYVCFVVYIQQLDIPYSSCTIVLCIALCLCLCFVQIILKWLEEIQQVEYGTLDASWTFTRNQLYVFDLSRISLARSFNVLSVSVFNCVFVVQLT